MATATSKASATRASKAAANLNPTSFGQNGNFIRYSLPLTTAALKKEFPGYDTVRVTSYIGGHAFYQPGATRDDSVEPIVMKAADHKKFLAKHNLQDITNNHVFGISRQIVGQKSKNPAKVAELMAEFNASRASIG